MPNRRYTKIQEALDALTEAERNLNELDYYRSCLLSPNHSASACSSVYNKIGTLKTKHTALVNALFAFGGNLGGMEAALAASNNSEYENTKAPQFYYTSAPEHQKSGWEKFWEQIILGEFSEETTWEGVVGNIGISLVAGLFGVDAPLDIRDAAGNISKGDYGAAFLDCVFLLPIVGAFKPLKYGDEVADVIKYGDDAASLIKYGDDVASVVKYGDDIVDTTATVVNKGSDLIKNSDFIVKGLDDLPSSVKLDDIIPKLDGKDVTKLQHGDLRKRMLDDFDGLSANELEKFKIDYQAQHIIPFEFKEHPVLRKIDMDINHPSNGLFLKNKVSESKLELGKSDGISALTRHTGGHEIYNDFVKGKLDAMDLSADSLTLQKDVKNLQDFLRYEQLNGLPLYKAKDLSVAQRIKNLEKGADFAFSWTTRGGGATIDLWERRYLQWMSRKG